MIRLALICALFSALFSSCSSADQPTSEGTISTESPEGTERDTMPIIAVPASGNSLVLTIEGAGNTMADIRFDPAAFAVEPGDSVRITLKNTGVDAMMQHNLVIILPQDEDLVKNRGDVRGKPGVIAATDIGPGKETVLEFLAPAAGEYLYVCTFPGHLPGMRGRMLVK